MKKKVLSLLLMLFGFLTIANAQLSEEYNNMINKHSKNEKVIILIKASGLMTFGTDLLDDGGAFGGDYCLGVNTDFYYNDLLFGSGLEFVTRTYDYENYAKFIGRYISIPLNISSRGETFYVKTGFNFDFNISSTTKVNDVKVDIEDLYNVFRMGLHFETGYCGWEHFDLGVYLGWNFTNFINTQYINKNLKDWNLGLILTYRL